jgi:hypothetical protein
MTIVLIILLSQLLFTFGDYSTIESYAYLLRTYNPEYSSQKLPYKLIVGDEKGINASVDCSYLLDVGAITSKNTYTITSTSCIIFDCEICNLTTIKQVYDDSHIKIVLLFATDKMLGNSTANNEDIKGLTVLGIDKKYKDVLIPKEYNTSNSTYNIKLYTSSILIYECNAVLMPELNKNNVPYSRKRQYNIIQKCLNLFPIKNTNILYIDNSNTDDTNKMNVHNNWSNISYMLWKSGYFDISILYNRYISKILYLLNSFNTIQQKMNYNIEKSLFEFTSSQFSVARHTIIDNLNICNSSIYNNSYGDVTDICYKSCVIAITSLLTSLSLQDFPPRILHICGIFETSLSKSHDNTINTNTSISSSQQLYIPSYQYFNNFKHHDSLWLAFDELSYFSRKYGINNILK